MSTNFPTSLDTFTTRSNGDVIQPAHVNELQTNVVALETRVGITGSADATSLTKRIAVLEAAGSGGAGTSGQVLAKGFANHRRRDITGGVTATSGVLWVQGVHAPRSETLTKMSINVSTAGTSVTLFKLGLYTLDASGNGTLVASTASAHVAINAASTNTKLDINLASNYAVVAGTLYATALISVGGTPPVNLGRAADSVLVRLDTMAQPFLGGSKAALSDLPGSFTIGTISVGADVPYIEITA